MSERKCPNCGQGKVFSQTFRNFPTKVSGSPFVVPDATIGVCNHCGSKIFDQREVRRWKELFQERMHSEGQFLSPREILRIREALRLSISDFASLLGCTRQTVYNWEREDRNTPQLRMADLLIRLVAESLSKGRIDVVRFLRERTGQITLRNADTTRPHRPTASPESYEALRYDSTRFDCLYDARESAIPCPRLM